MILFKQAEPLKSYLHQQQAVTGFVPTMGALHNGHLSLIEASRKATGITVCSIFVNPTQFNNPDDYRKYPMTLENDILLLESAGTDILFLPSVEEIYPAGTGQLEHYDLGYLESVLEGAYRPGHFQGVCQVMKRLLDQVQPRQLFMGSKDYQQCMVVQKLIELEHMPVQLVTCATEREPDGLAMSSRNLRLQPEERKKSNAIYNGLVYLKNNLQPGDLSPFKQQALRIIESAGMQPDYLELADAGNLKLVQEWDGKQPLVALAAAFMGEVRLIDNMAMNA